MAEDPKKKGPPRPAGDLARPPPKAPPPGPKKAPPPPPSGGGGSGSGGGGGGGEGLENFKLGEKNRGLIRDSAVVIDQARAMGLHQGPSMSDFVEGQLAGGGGGASLAELLPRSLPKAVEALAEPDLRPPPFLSPFEAMKDIYFKVKGRASPKTQDLLTSADLEDLVNMVRAIQDNDELAKKVEARIKGPIAAKLKEDPGPLLVGFHDPRLYELWRLLLDGWDIWTPEDKKGGIELFWEGEGEDEFGGALEILQVLKLQGGEVVLETKLGADKDSITFDGEGFYRLTDRRSSD